MAIIPRYTSRALPEGAQAGLIDSARSRGKAGARLASAAGGAIAEGVKYKKRKDEVKAAEQAYRTQTLNELKEAAGGLGDSIEDFDPFGDLDSRPLPEGWTVGFGEATPTGDAAAATRTGGGMAMRTGQQKQVRAALDRQSDETLLASFETAMTQARAAAQAAAAKPGTPAKDMARLALAQFDREVAKLSKGLEDRPHLKSRFDALVASSRAPMELRMLTAENARRADEEKAVLSESLAGLALAAAVDPAMAPGVTGRGFAQIEAAMKAGMLDPEEAAAMQGAFAENVHMSAMRGQIAADPAQALGKLESGEFDTVLAPGARDVLAGEARTTARVRGAEAAAAARARRRALELDMEEHLAALAETGTGDAALEARARAELTPEDYAAFEAKQAAARERYATRQEYAFMTPQQMAEDIAVKAPGGGPRETNERAAGDDIRRQVRDEVLAARAADPAGWAMQDESVAAAYRAAEENPDDPALTRRAAGLRLALQHDMGIAQPRLLSEAERNAISERMVAMTPTERLSEIRQLSARRPDDFARILVELAGSVDADTIRLASYASSPGAVALLAKGIEKAQVNGPAKAEGDAPLLPMVERSGAGEIDMRRIRPFRQYVLPDGDRVAHDGEALVPADTIQATAPKTLQGGAVLWPGSESGPRPIDWSGIIERIPRLSVRGAVGAAGAAALTLLTPWNAEDEYRYFGEGARLRTAPGDLYGSVQEFDADAGEWVETGLVGFAVSAGLGAPASVVTGTPEQIVRVRADSLTAPEGQLPPSPGLVPPVVPDTGSEEFPAGVNAPVIHVTPSNPSATNAEIFPIPEGGEPQILVFPDMSKESAPYIISESRKGNAETRAQLDYIRDRFLEIYPKWKHIGGGRDKDDGSELKEHWLPGPASAFLNEKGRKGDGRPGGKWADLTFESPSGTVVHIQTVDVDKYGKPTERELENAEAIRRATGETVILIPKPRQK